MQSYARRAIDVVLGSAFLVLILVGIYYFVRFYDQVGSQRGLTGLQTVVVDHTV